MELNEEKKYIVARLCRIRTHNKPKIGKMENQKEVAIKGDIVESIHFVYRKEDKVILMQQNLHTSSNSGSLLYRLLADMKDDLKGKLSISIILRNDAIKEIINNRGLIKKINLVADKDNMNKLLGKDVDANKTTLMDIKYEEVSLDIKIGLGNIKESTLKKIIYAFQEKTLNNVVIHTEDDRINISKYIMKKKVQVPIDNGNNFITKKFYKKLQEV